MAKTKLARNSKQQLGQFMTPSTLVESVLSETNISLTKNSKILEPSLGQGAFIFGLIDKLLPLYPKNISKEQKLLLILRDNLYGVEYDQKLFNIFKNLMLEKYSINLDKVKHNFIVRNFFLYENPVKFDFIIGNPPFGGSFDPLMEEALDKKYGQWKQWKIKKETYAFFTVICLGMLAESGVLSFILSDTFLTISTMEGMRRLASSYGTIDIKTLDYFSEETNYGMAILNIDLRLHPDYIKFNNNKISIASIENTPNYSWRINSDFAKYFGGKKLSDFILASSGMTIGKNELFLREIREDNTILEPYTFQIIEEKVTLDNEIKKARLGKISLKKMEEIKVQEKQGITKKAMLITPRNKPSVISIPNKDYKFYNKATKASYYEKPKTAIYWKNDGQAVHIFKKSGPWYLHGVGGKPFFGEEGFTWNLISTSIKARYLPSGYILDSGAPIAILKPDIDSEELWFLLGWINTKLATNILKQVINHTQNIQSKDIEKMPYPTWVTKVEKKKAIGLVKEIVYGLRDKNLSQLKLEAKIAILEKLYSYKK